MSFEGNIGPEYLDALYQKWQQDPRSVPPTWQAYFAGFELGCQAAPAAAAAETAFKQSAVQSLIYRYRDIGHLLACTDPLAPCPVSHPLLELAAFGLSEADLDTPFATRNFVQPGGTLREIVDILQQTYCRFLGVEFMHIQDPHERQWLKERMEPVRNRPAFSFEQKTRILWKLSAAAQFEAFLHKKFLGQKRFSLEGAETLMPLLDHLVSLAAAGGITDLILGMPHRGRLNVLTNLFNKPYATIFGEFEDNLEYAVVGEGDVKYHKGFSTEIETPGGHRIHLTLASNPSHLEAVDPVVEGKCRARQDGYGEAGHGRVLPVLLHGDAAFAGQGLVSETLNLSQLDGYRTGGTVHVVVNNQIGFTTLPTDARSTRYATDVAKMLSVPIFHVHGEDPEAALFAIELAFDYRQQFGRDVVVELICYRRHGHNEGDEPFFTQPLMYEAIRNRPSVHELYAAQLEQEGLSRQQFEEMTAAVDSCLELALDSEEKTVDQGFQGKWQDIDRDTSDEPVDTAVAKKTLIELGRLVTALPQGFTPHPKIAKLMENRRQAIESGDGIDWGGGEALAFASLLHDGVSIRLSGQDCRRGTFNHRHAALIDSATGKPAFPLADAARGEARLHIYNSLLSEAAVLGFDYGYSLETPDGLTLWEAQFGDFANGAQVIIDQFIASSGAKWDRASGLVMLLPHGFEGQGPEHSSARIERYLQLCAHRNLIVVNPSTPAQLFHLLRRQVRQAFRRPLIVFTPKGLLRHPLCRSRLDDFAKGRFEEVLTTHEAPKKVRRVLLCSGRIYYDLRERLEEKPQNEIALVRIEQLYPLAAAKLAAILKPWAKAETFAWVQEEPQNGGAWNHLRPQLSNILGREPEYIGRDEAASPAVGSHKTHQHEQQAILDLALGSNPQRKAE
ncbi:2-oxoglutarate dehydrogenase E1 component [Trichloromonas sp.]|uniref:2-oxoglutarate dehydrogenase E1 component n=1 Tax=Trichloromonas sp. TaxID=3069249 RepID=UPI003D813DDE